MPLESVEAVGYIGRALGHFDPQDLNPYIVQTILILLAPALYAATIYMTLGRLIRAVDGAKYSFIRPTWLTKIFVSGDVLTFLIQSAGGGILSTAEGDQDQLELGEKIIWVGLILQLVIFGIFILVAFLFHRRMRKGPTPQSSNPEIKWEKMLYVLYSVSVIIMVRNIFRLAEYIGGYDGVLLSVEWPHLVFDTLLMAATMAIFYWWYPTMFMQRRDVLAPGSSHEMLPSRDADGPPGNTKDEEGNLLAGTGVRGRIMRALKRGN